LGDFPDLGFMGGNEKEVSSKKQFSLKRRGPPVRPSANQKQKGPTKNNVQEWTAG